MEQIVTDKCYKGCPLMQIDSYYQGKCKHPEVGNQGRSIGDYQNDIPDWCPLNKESITITKNK